MGDSLNSPAAQGRLRSWLERLDSETGSDLHLNVGAPPIMRINGNLQRLPEGALSAADMQEVIDELLSGDQHAAFDRSHELDIGYYADDIARFRVNLFRQKGQIGAAFRRIPSSVPTIEELGLPAALSELSLTNSGLVLITGAAGSGKSTTQAAMIDHINHRRPVHIVTMEDPIEFVHEDDVALINQREVGSDTDSFDVALKHVLRQDPNVILIGEMRNLETIASALTAAGTGHLVIGTLHTSDTVGAIDRIIDAFPHDQQNQVRTQLAGNLMGVISQRLVPRDNSQERAAAFEVLVVTPAVRGLIREGKSHQIRTIMQTGSQFGMMTLDQHLAHLARSAVISPEAALRASSHPEEVRELIGTAGLPEPAGITAKSTQRL